MSVMLSVCLILASLPAECYGSKVQAEGTHINAASFSDVSEESSGSQPEHEIRKEEGENPEDEETEESQVSPLAEEPKKVKPECGVISEKDATIKDCKSDKNFGAIQNNGGLTIYGGVYENNLTVEKAVFQNNQCSELGGAIYYDGQRGKMEMSGEVQFCGIDNLPAS